MFAGIVELEAAIDLPILVKNSSQLPINSDALPTYRVYDPNGLVANQTGTVALKDSKAITGATNATPIVVTSAGHGLTTGTVVTVTGVLGNTGANGSFSATRIDADTFSLDSSVGNSAYTSGGVWNVRGLYHLSLTCSAANGYVSGTTYTVLASGAISSTSWAQLITFLVG